MRSLDSEPAGLDSWTRLLTLRRPQLEALAEARHRDFMRRLEEHVRRFWGERCATMSDERVALSIAESVRRAEGYGLVSEVDIAQFVSLCWIIHPEFDRDPNAPWIADLLGGGLEPDHKIMALQLALKQEGLF
jgi:hypothetical protein